MYTNGYRHLKFTVLVNAFHIVVNVKSGFMRFLGVSQVNKSEVSFSTFKSIIRTNNCSLTCNTYL
jgi:hypothetical protein